MKKNVNLNLTHKNRKKNWLINVINRFFDLSKKNKDVWIFASHMGKYQDNSMFLFEYVSKNEKDIDAYYFVRDTSVYEEITKKGFKAVIIGTKKAKYIAKKAYVSFYTHGIDDFGDKVYNYNSYLVALWHGAGFKKIYYANENKTPILKKLYRYLFSYIYRDLTIATSEYSKYMYVLDFKLKNKSNIAIVGQPRNDLLIEKSNQESNILLYAPTYRKFDDNKYVREIINFFTTEKGEEFLKKQNLVLYVKLHPLMEGVKIEENDVVFNAYKMETQQLLSKTKILITDYSSISSDFSLLRRNIILYTPDIKEYIANEPLDEKCFELYNEKYTCNTIEDVLHAIINDKCIYNKINEIFNNDLTGEYSKKIIQIVRNDVNEKK